MSNKMLRPFIVKVSVLGYFPLGTYRYNKNTIVNYLTINICTSYVL